jgi:hypothetical protein
MFITKKNIILLKKKNFYVFLKNTKCSKKISNCFKKIE